jgi:copper homeostasis protein (lipoprotein)
MTRNARRRTGVFPVLLSLAVLTGCQGGRVAPPVTIADDQVAPAVSAKKVLAVYQGVLPCADCTGIRTELTLFDEDFTYKLVETYLGTPEGARTFASDGTWTLLRAPAEDPDRKVYQLRASNPGDVRSFLVLDDWQIRQLDAAGRKLESGLDYTLTRKGPPPPSL